MKKHTLIFVLILAVMFILPQTTLADTSTDTTYIPGIPVTGDSTTNQNTTNETTTNETTTDNTTTDNGSTVTEPYDGKDYVILTPDSKVANVNGTKVPSPAPYINNGTTMLPLRFICQDILGATVTWNSSTKCTQVDKNDISVQIDLKKGTVISNGTAYPMAVKPTLKNNTTYIPLRLLVELFNCQVNYDAKAKNITVLLPEASSLIPPIANAQFTTITAGQALNFIDSSYDPNGLSIIKHEWKLINNGVTTSGESINTITKKLGEGTYTIYLRVQNSQKVWSDWYSTSLTILKNEAPSVYNFNIDITSPRIGEDIDFIYGTQNETWEEITATSWTFSWVEDGVTITKNYKPRAFFRSGTTTVTLKVKDAYGNWSEAASINIDVSKNIINTEAAYKFANLIKGDLYLNMAKVNFNLLDTANMINFSITPLTQLFSDNPEKVAKYGILYQDKASGDVRLHYYHENAMSTTMKIYTLVHNTSTVPVTITIGKVASAGPTTASLHLGTRLGENYFNAVPSGKTITLAPGDKYLLNPGIQPMKTGEVEASIIDVNASSQVSFIMVAMSDQMNYKDYTYLYQLTDDNVHSRGTFLNGGIDMAFDLDGSKAEKIILGRADANEEYCGVGIDATTGKVADNYGNYGVLHTITITADKRTGIFANPRGSIYQGVLCWNGEVRPISAMGFMQNSREAAVMGIIEAGETVTITYMTPDGSDSPMLLVAIPEDLWDNY